MAASEQGGRQGAADEAIGAGQKNVQAQNPREGTGFGRRGTRGALVAEQPSYPQERINHDEQQGGTMTSANRMCGRQTDWISALKDGAIMGAAASVLSTAALIASGKREGRRWAATVNTPSQWLWGEEARQVEATTLRHTATGYAIHHATSVFWAVLYARYARGALGTRGLPAELAAGCAAAALACFVDYRMTPRRLQPGFDAHLPRKSMAGVYAAFGVGLGLASWLLHRR
jgi:hypothetical protein